ncbi:exodeoxyribonuclease VII small subunit [Acidaminococcus timonensis]|uniref:exodeoxyribonuclease VII small subunit n=1 Tax=Acidaminococcus timonensis TaxID=1871002 RepID=UPI0030774F43
MPRKKAETVSFEESLKRLETIVEQLESGDLPLDQTVALYKEGMELSQNCAAQLKKVQQDVKKIVETSQDDFKLALFPEENEQ